MAQSVEYIEAPEVDIEEVIAKLNEVEEVKEPLETQEAAIEETLDLGEAVVIINEELKKNFRFSIKHFGGMYSKGFVLGLCFSSLFEDNLFFEIAKKENELAEKLYNDLTDIGIKMASCFETNQIFPILKNEIIEKLKEHIMFEVWEQKEFETTIRFVTSYMTTENEIKEVVNLIKSLK